MPVTLSSDKQRDGRQRQNEWVWEGATNISETVQNLFSGNLSQKFKVSVLAHENLLKMLNIRRIQLLETPTNTAELQQSYKRIKVLTSRRSGNIISICVLQTNTRRVLRRWQGTWQLCNPESKIRHLMRQYALVNKHKIKRVICWKAEKIGFLTEPLFKIRFKHDPHMLQ